MAELKLVEGYPEYMRASIARVEKTRPKRIGKLIPQMTPKEREDLLNLCHPDYAPGGKRKLKIGPNRGDLVPNEVADLLEAYPVIEPDKIEFGQIDYDTDILIIGGGLAGTSAALLANDHGIPADRILLTNKLRHGDANSMMAQGGTQAADRPEDSPVLHYVDAMGGGHFTNKSDVLRRLVEDAPGVLSGRTDRGGPAD